MSQQEHLNALKNEAISRMSPYELVARAVALRAEEHNWLGIEPLELDSSTFYTVTSGLATERDIRVEVTVEEDELVRRQSLSAPLTLFADVVQLKPPDQHNNGDGGDARLYRFKEALMPPLSEARLPFRTAALQIITSMGHSPVQFRGGVNTVYKVVPGMTDSEQTWLTSGSVQGLPLLAEEETAIQLQEVGKNELNREVGVLATVSGVAHVALKEGQFARVTDSGIFHGPSTDLKIKVDIPSGTPLYNRPDYHLIPEGATVEPDENGKLVVRGNRSNLEPYKSKHLNPDIPIATALNLMPEEAIDWTDGLKNFLGTGAMARNIVKLMPLDPQGAYEQTLQLARDRINAMIDDRRSTLGNVGCLAVAARLAELPARLDEGRRLTATFFDKVG